MKGYLGALVSLLLMAGCSNAPTSYFCFSPGSSCIEFRDGWTPEDAMDSCGSVGASFGDGVCPSGSGLGVCTVTVGTQTTAVFYYTGFGDGTEGYARMTCDFMGGAFTPL